MSDLERSTPNTNGECSNLTDNNVTIDREAARVAFEALRHTSSRQSWAKSPYTVEWAQYVLAQALGLDDHD